MRSSLLRFLLGGLHSHSIALLSWRNNWDLIWLFSFLWVKVMVRTKTAVKTGRNKKNHMFALQTSICTYSKIKKHQASLQPRSCKTIHQHSVSVSPFVCIHLSFGESHTPKALWGSQPSLQPHPKLPLRKWPVVNVKKLLQVYVSESYCLRSCLTFALLSGQIYYII